MLGENSTAKYRPRPRQRLSLLNHRFYHGHKKAPRIYENVSILKREKTDPEMASSYRRTGIPVLTRPQQSSFLHSTFNNSSAYRPLSTISPCSKLKIRPPRGRPNGSIDSDSSSSRCSNDSLSLNPDKSEIPSQMVATLTDQFNALIEKRKVQQKKLNSVGDLVIQKKTEIVTTTTTGIRSCPSSPQSTTFTRGKWSSVGRSVSSSKCKNLAPASSGEKLKASSTDSCDSFGSFKDNVKMTAVQRAARNYEVALQRTTVSSTVLHTTVSIQKTSPTCEDNVKMRPKVKPPDIPHPAPTKNISEKVESKHSAEDSSVQMDLLAEIDRHLKDVKEEVRAIRKEPNRSFLWRNSTQLRFNEEPKNDDDDNEEHLYEELSNYFSTHNSDRLEVPLAVPENDSSSSSSSYGYAATSLCYSVARSSFGSASDKGEFKDVLAETESDGGSWADDSDDEGHQWCKGQMRRKAFSKNVRENVIKNSTESDGVQSGGEGLWENGENIYEPLHVPVGATGEDGGKKVKRNWSWSKTRTEFHLDISSKLGRIRQTSKKDQNNKWSFKGAVSEKDLRRTDTEKEANAQFYIPSSSSSSESKINLETNESGGKRNVNVKRLSVVSRPTTAPPLPPVKITVQNNAKEDTDDDSSSTGVSRSCDHISESKENEEGEPNRFLYLDDTYYIDEDHKKLSPFDNEPLYQFYTMAAQQRSAHENQVDSSDDDCYETVYQGTAMLPNDTCATVTLEKPSDDQVETKLPPVPSAMELVRSTEGGVRTLWCEVPEVMASGVLDTITVQQRNLQEAMFEVITSEASYLKSLNILVNHFMMCPMFVHEFSSQCVLSKRERHVLFSDVIPVKETSERLLEALEERWQESILIKDICDILLLHATKYFDVYVKYCSNQLYQDRCLKKLKESNSDFVDVLRRLELNPVCQGLSMYSFLMLPMQRITRLPLLIDAIFHRLDVDNLNYDTCKQALATLNKIVHECNEGAQRMARMEEMLNISRQLDFRMFKGLALISASRWLVKQGELVRLLLGDSCKLSFGRNRCPKQVVHLFLFTDILVVTKKKSDDCYHVVDYCPRNMLQVTEGPDQLPDRILPDGCRNLFQITMLQNHNRKTVEMFFVCPMESDRTRWVEAIAPKKSDDPNEKIYEEWDCPQVQAIHNYNAQQPDELSLEESDVVNVFRKMADGWYQGERIRDGSTGWFPSNYTVEIVSSHVRARNLRQRYRLLALSQSYLEEQRRKETKLIKC